MDAKLWEYTKYYYDASLLMTKNAVLINQKAFDGLPKSVQDAVRKAAVAAEERGWKASEEADRVAKTDLSGRGVKVQKPNPQLQAELQKISSTIVAEWLKSTGADGKGIDYDGESALHDFLGAPLAALGHDAAVTTVVLDEAALAAFRERFPAHLDADRFELLSMERGA